MSTNIPERLDGKLSRLISGLSQSLEAEGQGLKDPVAGQAAEDLVRKVASSIEEALGGFLRVEPRALKPTEESVAPDISSSRVEDYSLASDITALKARIDCLRSEALRLMSSLNVQDRVHGRNDLQLVIELLNLLLMILEEQMQIRSLQAR
ncbi:MAG TPA: hypothetical protein VK466_09750 [Terriglobales bacterium]|nr:hypothetical protein [Terriglobales bacterium]